MRRTPPSESKFPAPLPPRTFGELKNAGLQDLEDIFRDVRLVIAREMSMVGRRIDRRLLQAKA